LVVQDASAAIAIRGRIDARTRASAAATEIVSVRVGCAVEREHATRARHCPVVAAIVEIAPIEERVRISSRGVVAPK
jgi:hypothetical protein